MVSGHKVRLPLGRQLQIRMPQLIQADHQPEADDVGGAQAKERRHAHQEHDGELQQRKKAQAGPKPATWATRASATPAADSTMTNMLARLKISFQLIVRVASSLQSSIARSELTASAIPLRSEMWRTCFLFGIIRSQRLGGREPVRELPLRTALRSCEGSADGNRDAASTLPGSEL